MILILLLSALVVPPSVSGQDFDTDFENFTTKKPVIYDPNSQRTCGSDAEEGVCVPKSQCVNGLVVVDGANRLVPRVQDSCSVNEECCRLPSENNPGNVKVDRPTVKPVDKPATKPVTTPVNNPDKSQQQTATSSEGCGVRHENGISFRNFGIDSALYGEFNWMVAVYQIKFRTEKYLCGGSLIHPRVVLTAALPVVRAKRLVIRAGDYDLLDTSETYPHQTIEVESIIRHKDFNSARFSHNIALLFLAKDVQPAPNVGYACLPRTTEVATHASDCIVTGWGKETLMQNTMVNVLKLIELRIVKMDKCLHQLRAVSNPKLVLDSTNICAGGDGIDSCLGDAGSPLVCPYPDNPERYYQAGITSFGVDCGANYIPGVYTNVASLRDWIDSNMAEKGYDQTTYTPPS